MHSDTESESDIESSQVGWMDVSSSEPISSSSSNLFQTVTNAIRSLKNVQLADIAATNAEDLHCKILQASNIINGFLEGMISNQCHHDALEELQLFASLVRPSFLAVLFSQRRIFHILAAKALAPRTRASTVVCWVDGLIAKVAEATVNVGCGSSMRRSVSGAMKAQLDDDGLRAAAQLPEKWAMVPSVIGSKNASPAAKRLAIQLTFAAYIVGPQLQIYDPWSDYNTPQADDMSKILDQYTLDTSTNEALVSYSTETLLEQIRMTYAMIISLFAASDSEVRRNQSTSPFRPRTLGGLLEMIQLILGQSVQDDSCIAPNENLDSAQILLLQWGSTMCWCWETWNDCRVANTECITQLTATWLYHLDLQGGSSTPYQDVPNAGLLLEKSPSAANCAIVQVLRCCMSSLLAARQSIPSQEQFFIVLSNSCYAVEHLLRNELVHERILAGTESTGKLTNRLLRGGLESVNFNSLRETVVTCFCILDTDASPPIQNPKQEDVWKFALNAGSSNLVVSSSFAHHIMATAHFPDPLSCAEAWDLLRDTMTLIFRRHFMEMEKPIALLVAPGVCGALLRLLNTNSSTAQFILTSPWTMGFCAELKTLLQEGSQEDYGRLLKDQLAPIGGVLLDVIRSKLDCEEVTAGMKKIIPKFKPRLVYYGRYPHYSLVLTGRSMDIRIQLHCLRPDEDHPRRVRLF